MKSLYSKHKLNWDIQKHEDHSVSGSQDKNQISERKTQPAYYSTPTIPETMIVLTWQRTNLLGKSSTYLAQQVNIRLSRLDVASKAAVLMFLMGTACAFVR